MRILKFNESLADVGELRDIFDNYLLDDYQMEISYFGLSKETKFTYIKNDRIYPKYLYKYQMPDRMGSPFTQIMDGSGFSYQEIPTAVQSTLKYYQENWTKEFIGIEIYTNPEYLLLNLNPILKSIKNCLEMCKGIEMVSQINLDDDSFCNGILSGCESYSIKVDWETPNSKEIEKFIRNIQDSDICFIQIFLK